MSDVELNKFKKICKYKKIVWLRDLIQNYPLFKKKSFHKLCDLKNK